MHSQTGRNNNQFRKENPETFSDPALHAIGDLSEKSEIFYLFIFMS